MFASVDFGTYGGKVKRIKKESANFEYPEAMRDASIRLEKMGVPLSSLKKKALGNLNFFHCDLFATSNEPKEGCRDIDFYDCKARGIRLKLPSFLEKQILLTPDDVWGYIPILPHARRAKEIKRGREIIALSNNNLGHESKSLKRNLLSPTGKIEKITSTEITSVDTYWAKGSSGGALLDFHTDQAIGVVSGGYWWFGAKYVSQALPAKMDAMLGDPIKTVTLQPGQKVTGLFNRPSFLHESMLHKNYDLPFGYLATGIVGSPFVGSRFSGLRRSFDGWLGNIGLVGLPFSLFEPYRFDKALVVARATKETNWKVANPYPFQEYINKFFYGNTSLKKGSGRIRTDFEQDFATCAPGFFLQGVQVRGSTIPSSKVKNVQQVVALQCGEMKNPARSYVRKLKRFGASSRNPATWIRCPSGMFVDGIQMNKSLPFLSFFRFTCRKPWR